ncbi:MAG TPA: lipopolysaccharide transport periplasmic protein LptA [Casimicrobiaceae bacterium]|nr:lipopolysaccharide transport periplasmic protein LptA [Casimicrobiaceae bacterium]
MTEAGIAACRAVALAACAIMLLGPGVVIAEKADRDKPIHFSAEQPAEVDFDKRVGTLRGNVVITQGTLTIHADRIDFKQNPDDSLSATAVGKPVSFRQKKDDSDEYFEGYAQRAVYDGQTQTLELFDNALLKQGKDEIHSNYISYNSATNMFRSEGRPNAPGAEGPGARVQGVFEPRTDTPLGGKSAPKSDGKEATPPGKDAAPAKDGKQAAAAKAAPPLKLTPDPTLQK